MTDPTFPTRVRCSVDQTEFTPMAKTRRVPVRDRHLGGIRMVSRREITCHCCGRTYVEEAPGRWASDRLLTILA